MLGRKGVFSGSRGSCNKGLLISSSSGGTVIAGGRTVLRGRRRQSYSGKRKVDGK